MQLTSCVFEQTLRLFDVDKCELRFEAPNGGSGLLDCCFESESVALTANSDGSVIRFAVCVMSVFDIPKIGDFFNL